MTRTKYRALVTVQGNNDVLYSPIRYARNTALEVGKSMIRDMRAGSWSIVRPEPWQRHLVRPGYLVLINDRDSRRAQIEVVEVP